MRKTLFLLAVAISFITACGEDTGLRGSRDRGGLSNSEFDTLKGINEIQGSNLQVVEDLYSTFVPPAAGSEKLSKMSKMVADNCASSGRIPADEMTGANNTQTIANGVGQCPIYWHRERSFSPGSGTMIFIDNFETRSNEYLELAPVRWRRVSGDYRRTVNGTTRGVRGSMTYSEFEVVGVGKLRGGITVDAQYPTTDRGGGYVSLTLASSRWNHTGVIQWDVRKFAPQYYVNGNEVERKVFDELFSSYGLTKIMENSLKMR